MKECKIGDIITLENGVKLRVEETLKKNAGFESTNCDWCYYQKLSFCSDYSCIDNRREDGKHVIFKEIKKWDID